MRRRLTVGWVAVVALVAVLSGCGFNVQTLEPYTPADGVNFAVGGDEEGDPTLKVRNLFLLSDDTGTGFVSAAMIVDDGSDTLRSIRGTALNPNGSDAGALTVSSFPPVELPIDRLVVLTNRAAITVSGPMKPGLEARLVLTFAQAGEYTITVPVISADDPVYASLTPSPAPSPSG